MGYVYCAEAAVLKCHLFVSLLMQNSKFANLARTALSQSYLTVSTDAKKRFSLQIL